MAGSTVVGRTLAGFMMLYGSSAFLIAAIVRTAPTPSSSVHGKQEAQTDGRQQQRRQEPRVGEQEPWIRMYMVHAHHGHDGEMIEVLLFSPAPFSSSSSLTLEVLDLADAHAVLPRARALERQRLLHHLLVQTLRLQQLMRHTTPWHHTSALLVET